ncbi:vitamin B12-binding protein precursor [Clostridium homopropionicum DSM 5847]|uniref:Vitamin B12-binding protein n=1 Tax=Clostridium homopropionicum DSM 5847 TaxID=1121318 RepID=A0A0L6ZAG1_9CLOT|nr:helical backbone metal receptor [Clostridium homopropionicum]KOA19763.1 vitamin B12-binding protein precursor [Clostridium homopropionicum DSM 5847]SFF78055.1 iron complex transport system substrate-binding protein [Clostridium homopropionicum]
MKRIVKNFIVALLAVVMMVTFAACGNTNNNGNKDKDNIEASVTKYPLTVKDSKGKEVVIEKEPERIISVAPNVTELIYALGKGNKLVGRTDYCDYPAEAKNVQSIGSLTNPNVEKIIELKPDVVIASTHFKDDVAKKLEDLGIKIIVLYNAEDFNGVYDIIDTLGKIVNAQDTARTLVSAMQKKIQEVKGKVEGKEAPKVYYVVGFGKDGDYTATGDTFIGQIIQMAGGTNIAKDATGWKYSLEKIIENDPEYIVLSKNYDMKAQFITTAGYKELSAVKNNKVIEIDDNLLNRQGPRLAEGVEALAKILHPDLFK